MKYFLLILIFSVATHCSDVNQSNDDNTSTSMPDVRMIANECHDNNGTYKIQLEINCVESFKYFFFIFLFFFSATPVQIKFFMKPGKRLVILLKHRDIL